MMAAWKTLTAAFGIFIAVVMTHMSQRRGSLSASINCEGLNVLFSMPVVSPRNLATAILFSLSVKRELMGLSGR